jgi:predicted unusual protein kinase regulating ubiquinone biosynthesis (AarF/ABC1/UbiB family)
MIECASGNSNQHNNIHFSIVFRLVLLLILFLELHLGDCFTIVTLNLNYANRPSHVHVRQPLRNRNDGNNLWVIGMMSPTSKSNDVGVGDDIITSGTDELFDRIRLEVRYNQDGTFSRRWKEVLKETAPFLQQVATLWASGRLKRDDPSLAAACRQTLTKLGPAFVKLGQILSVREDILGPVWSEELSKLQNSVDGFGGREALDEALQVEMRDQLEWFDPSPVAVASIAQVHKGTWRNKDGSATEVALKVLRPNVADQVGVDLCVLLRAGDLLSEWVPRILPVARVDWEALLAGLARGLWEEVDLAGEAQRQMRFRDNMESVPRVFVPKVVAYNRNVLISEWVDGTALRSIPSMDPRLKEAQALMRDAYCKSMYVDAFFHADGHGGNLLWVENGNGNGTAGDNGELCILDCGLMVDIERSAAEGLLRLSLHLAARDWTSVVDDIIALEFLPADLSPQLKAEARGIARRIIGPYLDVGGGAAGAASAYSVTTLFDDVSAATRKLPTSLPPDMILLARAVIQLEGLALRAYPDYRLVDDILPVAARIALRAPNDDDDELEKNDARTSLLYDLLYETETENNKGGEIGNDVYRGTKETKKTFSLDRLLNLLATATGGPVPSASGSSGSMSIDQLVEELLQADAARDLVAQEAVNVGDAIVRDAVWRGLDAFAERGFFLPRPPQFLSNILNLGPSSPMETLEKLAPRITEKEQLIVARLLEVLEELDENVKTRPSFTTSPAQSRRSASTRTTAPFEGISLVKMMRLPGVRTKLREVSTNALLNRDDNKNARAMVETVSGKLRDRVQTRLIDSGLVSPDMAATISKAVLIPILVVPWEPADKANEASSK